MKTTISRLSSIPLQTLVRIRPPTSANGVALDRSRRPQNCLHRNLRQALGVRPRPPSPIFVDDPNDEIDLDPELAKIAEAARQRVKHAYIDLEHTGGPETVDIKVRWRPHPRDPSAQEQCWPFQMKRHDTLRELFDGVADLAGVMANQLVITHNNRRVFASGTPHSLHIWAEGELEACDKHTAEYIHSQRSHRRHLHLITKIVHQQLHRLRRPSLMLSQNPSPLEETRSSLYSDPRLRRTRLSLSPSARRQLVAPL